MDGEAVSEIERITLTSATPEELTPGKIYVLHTRAGVHQIDLTGDKYRDKPARTVQTVDVRDVESFLAYFTRHATDESLVYADEDYRTITGIIDAHGAASPDWQGHRVQLKLQFTPEFKRWYEGDGRFFDQQQFAELLEDYRSFVVEPDAATMIELAQSFQATTKCEFASGFQVKDGQRQLQYTETVAAKAGTKGAIPIPDLLVLGLPVFKGATARDRIESKFRFRVTGDELRLFYKLDRIEDVLTGAFQEVRTRVSEGVDVDIVNGTAPR